jgi:hypothetical protein
MEVSTMAEMVNGVDVERALALAQKFLPHPADAEVAIPAPGYGEGFWTGAPSAAEHGGYIYLAYRLRHPIELGRGQGVVIARSADGVKFETVTMIPKDAMNAESLERPTLVRTPEGKWRLYLSCATTGTKHWRVEALEANTPAELNPTTRKVVLPGDDNWGVKDTVIVQRDGLWHLWATFHPLDILHEEDRMVSKYATSRDGLGWTWAEGVALSPRGGKWDSRGARVAAVHFAEKERMILAFYDGRASAAENYEERTGLAVGMSPDSFVGIGEEPFGQSPDHRGLRYLDILPLADGSYRTYYEIATDDGSHELRTEHIRP